MAATANTGRRAVGRTSASPRLTTETKSAFKTTEFVARVKEELWMFDVMDDGNVLVVAPTGELDLTTSPQLVAAFASSKAEHTALVCDIGRVTFIDSTGIQALLTLHSAEPDRFAIAGTSACVERLLELTGTATVFRRATTT